MKFFFFIISGNAPEDPLLAMIIGENSSGVVFDTVSKFNEKCCGRCGFGSGAASVTSSGFALGTAGLVVWLLLFEFGESLYFLELKLI